MSRCPNPAVLADNDSRPSPCPFCGGKADYRRYEHFLPYGERVEAPSVFCTKCPAFMTALTLEEAWDAWESRVDEDLADKLDAKLASAETYIATLEAERAEMVGLLRKAHAAHESDDSDAIYDWLQEVGVLLARVDAEAKG